MTFYRPHDRHQIFFDQPSLTKQSHKDECDINRILARYANTGILEHVRQNPGQFLDLPAAPDYQEAVNLVLEAEEAFQALPSKVRTRFDNDPTAFLAFATNPGNRQEMEDLGLLQRRLPDPDPVVPESRTDPGPVAPGAT